MACRTFKRASMTVEAAIAIPMFFLCLTACIFYLRIYSACVEKTAELQISAETMGMAVTEAVDDSNPDITLQGTVSVLPDWLPFSVRILRASCQARVHAWTGRTESDLEGQENETEQMVYVTDYQSVYHTTSRCTHLHLSIRLISGNSVGSLRNSSGSKYHACEKCTGSGQIGSCVYITDQGDKYHNDLECSGLKRSIRLVKLSEVSGLQLCSRCAALTRDAA